MLLICNSCNDRTYKPCMILMMMMCNNMASGQISKKKLVSRVVHSQPADPLLTIGHIKTSIRLDNEVKDRSSCALNHLGPASTLKISYGFAIKGCEVAASLMSCLTSYVNCFSPSETEGQMGR